jgi:hypothetical protein
MTTKPYLDGTHPDAKEQRLYGAEAITKRLLERIEFLEKRIEVLERKGSFVDARAVVPPYAHEIVDELSGHPRFAVRPGMTFR